MTASTTEVLVWSGGQRLALKSVPIPAIGDGELLVRVLLATVCGSDLHTVAGHRSAPCPSILGHEAVGQIVATGAGAAHEVGMRVVWGVTVSCHECDRCRAGRTAKCRSLRKFGHEAFDSPWPLSGAYARHVVLPAGTTVVPVPDDLPDRVAAPAACATATVMAVIEAAGPLDGRRVLVSGAGMLGVTAVAAARASGASRIVVTDLDAGRMQDALRFGADDAIPVGEPPPQVDAAIELSGAHQGVATALNLLDVGGRLVLAGSVSPGPTVPIDPERVVRRWLTVTGVHNYEPRHLTAAVDLLATTPRLPWGDLVDDPVPLADASQVLTAPSRGRQRASVVPGAEDDQPMAAAHSLRQAAPSSRT